MRETSDADSICSLLYYRGEVGLFFFRGHGNFCRVVGQSIDGATQTPFINPIHYVFLLRNSFSEKLRI